ncbi:unnamed protein product, partial [Durusdinium trenchii]
PVGIAWAAFVGQSGTSSVDPAAAAARSRDRTRGCTLRWALWGHMSQSPPSTRINPRGFAIVAKM